MCTMLGGVTGLPYTSFIFSAGLAEAEKTGPRLAAGLAAAGHSVISGGAFGIDAAAHEGALDAGGTTFAVLGCGVDVVYPDRHESLFARVRAGSLKAKASRRARQHRQPCGLRLDGCGEGPSLFCQRVLDAHRRLRNDGALDDPFALQLLQALAEHPVGDLRNGVAQVGETAARLEEEGNDGTGPAPAD